MEIDGEETNEDTGQNHQMKGTKHIQASARIHYTIETRVGI